MRPLIGALALIAAWFASLSSFAASVVAEAGLSALRMDTRFNSFPRSNRPIAARLRALVGRNGMENTNIVVTR